MKVVLTGATGFVGAPLLRRLLDDGHPTAALTRDAGGALPADAARRVVASWARTWIAATPWTAPRR